MDRGRRAEPYSNATIWTREVAKNLAGHLSRVSKAHSCVDTKSPKSTRLPQFHHSYAQKRCPTSPMKTRQPLVMLPRNPRCTGEQELDFRGLGESSAREETDGASELIDNAQNSPFLRKHHLTTRKTDDSPTQPQNDDTNSGVEANQEIQDRLMRIPAVKAPAKQHHYGTGNADLDDMAYDCPPILPHQRNRLGHDYYKRQEQKKIWQENQALIKRLQSTKATLNSKEWKKDSKWTQEFLKTQEKRRSALQQELRRAQVSPHAIVRSKPLKPLYPHNLKTAHHESHSDKILGVTCCSTNADVAGVHSAHKSSRHESKRQVPAESREAYDGIVLPASAANHRRILELRKQKPSLERSDAKANVIFTESATIDPTDNIVADNQAAFIPDNEIVNVRFTFSRGRCRGSDVMDQSAQPQSLDMNESDRGMMSLSGAFSPGIELESALNAVAVDEIEFNNQRSPDQPPYAVDSECDEVPVEAYSSQQIELDSHADGSRENSFGSPDIRTVENAVETVLPSSDTTEDNDSHTDEPGRIMPEDAAFAVYIPHGNHPELPAFADCERGEDVEHQSAETEKPDVEATDTAINTGEKNSPSVVEQKRAELNDGDDEEEAYEEDNFDDDPASPDMGEYGKPPEQTEDKGEASGYGSEFEDEAAVLAIPLTELPPDNQDEGEHDEEDASYSNDDFVE